MAEDTEQDLTELAIAAGNADGKPDRYVSGITSVCRFCGYEESIEIPEIASPEDIIQALVATITPCPECQERLRKDIEVIDLAELGEF